MSGVGHNNPPVVLELTSEEAAFLRDALDAELATGLSILTAVQAGQFSPDAAEKVVAKMEAVRPVFRKLKEAMQ